MPNLNETIFSRQAINHFSKAKLLAKAQPLKRKLKKSKLNFLWTEFFTHRRDCLKLNFPNSNHSFRMKLILDYESLKKIFSVKFKLDLINLRGTYENPITRSWYKTYRSTLDNKKYSSIETELFIATASNTFSEWNIDGLLVEVFISK